MAVIVQRRAMSISVFLSTVSDEFRSYRDLLVHDLTRHNVAVKVQEDFKDLGGDTLEKLDAYIADCDAVVHLVGDMCGAVAGEAQQRALLARRSDLAGKLVPLADALRNAPQSPTRSGKRGSPSIMAKSVTSSRRTRTRRADRTMRRPTLQWKRNRLTSRG